MTMIRVPEIEDATPLDVIEQIVAANDWVFDRPNDQEIAVQIPGKWCDYNVFCAWNAAVGAMHFTVAFDTRVPKLRRGAIHELLALINDKVWMGHFAIWQDEGLLAYRHALPLRGSGGPSFEQVEDLLQNALIDCERFYPAFQYVVWGGKSAEDALAAAMIETVGEA
ncbi:MAG: YbjN domain-containing protein [Rhodospirillales bacterium]|nr:YbjN domain-containing protein [Rhodospirillales bacterium]